VFPAESELKMLRTFLEFWLHYIIASLCDQFCLIRCQSIMRQWSSTEATTGRAHNEAVEVGGVFVKELHSFW
jgi:hypothetical protein